jgi:tRNA G18 (ribose-2'-O)-methylase SpoU
MESFEHLYRTKYPLQFLKNSKTEGFKIIGTGLDTNPEISSSSSDNFKSSNDKIILLLGNEGNGLSQEVLSLCDFNVTIPSIYNSNPIGLDSLNVSVATGIILDRLRNHRL